MHFHRISSTSLTIIVCWLGASLTITEGFVGSKTSPSTTNTVPSTHSSVSNSNSYSHSNSYSYSSPTTRRRIPTTAKNAERPTMLSHTASSSSASTMTTTTTTTTFLHPRRRFPGAARRRTANPPFSLDVVERIPSGGAARPTALASTMGFDSMPTSTSLFSAASGETPDCPFTRFMAVFGSVWGSFGVVYILAKAIFRVLPIALEPLYGDSSLVLSKIQWSLYTLSCLFFAYAEGYKGFHKKFAPLVVKRSFTLVIGTAQGNNPFNYLMAPLYSMGLWGSTPRRRAVSWGLSLGIAVIVALVKRLPPAPRCVLDAGVVVGLSAGSASILYHYASSILTGKLPDVDACLPNNNNNNNKSN